ncbi:MAG: hypothetical protein HFJ54_08290 [Clostridia bacterium]|nr:hypothetical protein [Clostridia bacterium]
MISLWGANKNGECANKDVNYANVQTVDFKVINISCRKWNNNYSGRRQKSICCRK